MRSEESGVKRYRTADVRYDRSSYGMTSFAMDRTSIIEAATDAYAENNADAVVGISLNEENMFIGPCWASRLGRRSPETVQRKRT